MSPDGGYEYFTSNRDGEFALWMREAGSTEARQVDLRAGANLLLPQSNKLYLKFVITRRGIVPSLESLRSEVYLLRLRKDSSRGVAPTTSRHADFTRRGTDRQRIIRNTHCAGTMPSVSVSQDP